MTANWGETSQGVLVEVMRKIAAAVEELDQDRAIGLVQESVAQGFDPLVILQDGIRIWLPHSFACPVSRCMIWASMSPA